MLRRVDDFMNVISYDQFNENISLTRFYLLNIDHLESIFKLIFRIDKRIKADLAIRLLIQTIVDVVCKMPAASSV